MTDDELRALVRDAVARHLGRSQPPPDLAPATTHPRPPARPHDDARSTHFSHAMYMTLVNAGDACLIEPDVPCNHCGYCKSHGH